MIEILSDNFRLEILYKEDRVALLGATKGVFVHLLLYDNKNIRQIYIHRHEWADFLIYNQLLRTTYCGVNLIGSLKSGGTGIYYKEIERLFSLYKTTLGKQLIEDSQKLFKIRNQSGSESFRKKIITKIAGSYNQSNKDQFTDWELEVSAFENAILTGSQKRKTTQAAVYKLLSFIKSESTPVELFVEKLEWIVENTSCDCGKESCFFDILNHTFLTQFRNRKRFITKGKFDPNKGEAIFMDYWMKLDARKKMILNYLDFEFGNTALLNMAFFNPDFDIWNYQQLMTYPYQPDDKDEAWVRQHSSLCAWYSFMMR